MTSVINIIENSSIILTDNQTEYMCVINSNQLEDITEQWKYNRNLNFDKVKEIKNAIKDKIILDSVLHFFYTNENANENLICFDGNHRREALILLNKIDNINIKVCCYIYKNNDLKNINIEIMNKFKIINQMTPIPDIYSDIIDNLNKTNQNLIIHKKDIIEELFTEYKVKYKKFYSINSKCRRPNFNDTVFKDLCAKFQFNDKKELHNLLLQLNDKNKLEQIRTNVKTIISNQILTKCKTNDFYLFINI